MNYKQEKRYLIEIKNGLGTHTFYSTKIAVENKQQLDKVLRQIKDNFTDFVVGVSKKDCTLELTELSTKKVLSLI